MTWKQCRLDFQWGISECFFALCRTTKGTSRFESSNASIVFSCYCCNQHIPLHSLKHGFLMGSSAGTVKRAVAITIIIGQPGYNMAASAGGSSLDMVHQVLIWFLICERNSIDGKFAIKYSFWPWLFGLPIFDNLLVVTIGTDSYLLY